MGLFPTNLAERLRDELSLERAVETGTYKGDGLRTLAGLFASAQSVEISAELAETARRATVDIANAEVLRGNSREVLPQLVDPTIPTLYWLDGHWSGAATGGREEECPVLGELAATALGHPRDCILIDDARLFLAPPPAPHDATLWPTFMQIYDTLHTDRPEHHITVLHDIVIAVPRNAKPIVDGFARKNVGNNRIDFGRRALGRVLRRFFGR